MGTALYSQGSIRRSTEVGALDRGPADKDPASKKTDYVLITTASSILSPDCLYLLLHGGTNLRDHGAQNYFYSFVSDEIFLKQRSPTVSRYTGHRPEYIRVNRVVIMLHLSSSASATRACINIEAAVISER